MEKIRSKRSLTKGLIFVALGLAAVTVILALVCIPFYNEDPAVCATEPPLPSTEPTELTEPTLPPPDPNPYGQLDFQYDENNYLKLLEGDSVTGIDVSSYQKDIDFAAVKASGVDFVIIRLGYRGYESGKIVYDKYAKTNLDNAIEAGLDVGVYFFSQAITPEEAEEEAYFVLSAIEGYDITMPIVYDWESVSDPNARTANMDRDTLMACVDAFCRTVEEAGYEAMVYFNPALAESLLDLEELLEYPWWLAMYSERMTFPHAVAMWQYTASGSVPGIEGDTDINLWFP
jgi:GH25 family lysozyme M1 (1,4-beta-N-acetylmuramidase)